MTLIELFTAITLFLLFMFALVPAVQPTLEIMGKAQTDRKFASSVSFLRTTFETACTEDTSAIDDWEENMVYIDGVSEIIVTAVEQKTDYQLFRADCQLYGQHISILGILAL